MKVVIIDDEKHVIEAVRLLVDWETLGFTDVYSSTDSKNGLEMIEKLQPELVLTDMMMPTMHGMEVMDKIRSHNMKTQIIVISGYLDFNYIQHTIRQGGLDYITKPIEPEQLVRAVKKAIQTIQEMKSIDSQKKDMWKINPLFMHQLFTQALETGSLIEENQQKLAQNYRIREKESMQIAVLKVLDEQNLLRSRFNKDITLMQFAIRNIVNEVIDSMEIQGFVYKDMEDEIQCKILLWENMEKVALTIRSIIKSIRDVYGVESYAGLSDVFSFPKELPKSGRQAQERLCKANIMERNLWIYQQVKKSEEKTIKFALNYDSIVRDIKTMDKRNIEKEVEDAFKNIDIHTYLNEEMYRELIDKMKYSLNYYMTQLGLQYRTSIFFPTDKYFFTSTLLAHIKEEYRAMIYEIMATYHKERKKEEPMEQVKAYIENHYDENISLKTLADIFHLSKEHISRKFKLSYNTTVLEYIKEKRMKKSKELLENTEMSIKDVAALVGYEDVKYFSKVFRNTYKCTPTDFRNT